MKHENNNYSDKLRIKLKVFTKRNNKSIIKIKSFKDKELKFKICKELHKIKYLSFKKLFRIKELI